MGENKNEKKKSSGRAWLVIFVITAVWLFNNYTLKTTEVDIASAKVSEPVRFAVISDLHTAKLSIRNSTILSKVKKAEPDAVFILGDMYTSGSEWELIQKPIDLTADIVKAGFPVYFVTGEHDTDKEYISQLEKAGARFMGYESEVIKIKGSRFQIMGIDNVYYSPTFDLSNELTLYGDCYNILLAHIPNYAKFSQFGAELSLCGDTHGGMARLPFGGGPLYYAETSTWFPKLRGSEQPIYDKGLFEYDGGYMFITSGIGASPAPVRFGNRPEVAVINILPEE